MKKRMLAALLAASMVMSLAACGSKEEAPAEPEKKEEAPAAEAEEEKEEAADPTCGLTPEVTTINWAQGLSGNVFVTLAKKFGYFDEVGLEINEIPLDASLLPSVIEGQADIASNAGTNTPVQMIAKGDDLAIIGGFMVEGSMPVITQTDREWNGVTDFVGHTVAGTPNHNAYGQPLLDAGYNPMEDVEWITVDNDADKIPAVANGEVDYAVLGTGRMYLAKNTEGVKIVNFIDDFTPDYSCCRMVARNSWVKENPNTVVLLDMALLRAQRYFEENREECVKIMAEELQADEDYVAAYMMETEHYKLNVDTLKKGVVNNFKYQQSVGLIDDTLPETTMTDVIYVDLYKQALDNCVALYYDEDPAYWDACLAYFEEQN